MKICKDMERYVEVRENSEISEDMLDLSQCVRRYVTICEHMLKYVKIC